MARTTAAEVKLVLRYPNAGSDYDGTTDLTPFINAANAVVSRVNTCATNKGITLSTDELTLIETWLAAHAYTKADRVFSSKSTLRASGSFVLDKNNPEPYLSMALSLDPSGCLSAITNPQKNLFGGWGGKKLSEQLDYDDRN